MDAPYWEHFHHEADIGVRGVGRTLAEAFEQSASAMTAVITELERVRPLIEVPVAVEAPDVEYLLFQWLNELVFLMATRRMLFGRYRVDIAHRRLTGTAWGEPVERPRHRPAVEIKGATLTALEVRRRDDGLWLAQCVVDV
ncbi:MAG: archease [Candidatus Thiodiazotropha sp. (ex Epidulcina cf. delphinae)]|nr:archease [Candidatus Thiodiazotropha sp. (ex Epidulcina cf. delphinae)]